MNKQNEYLEEIPNVSNVWLQILLTLNVYLSGAWSLAYGINIIYNLSYMGEFHGMFIVIAYVLSAFAECWRLYMGYSGNLRARTSDLSLFLLSTPLIQLPLVLFLYMSAQTQLLLITILAGCLLVFMALEFIVGIFAWRKICHYQVELFKLSRDINMHAIKKFKQQ